MGVVAAVRPRRFISIFFGLDFDIFIMILVPDHYDSWVDVYVPIRPLFGVELEVARRIALFGMMGIGPAIGSHEECRDWNPGRDEWDRCHTELDVHFSGRFYFGAIFFF